MKNTKYLYKDAFAVVGKAGQGVSDNPQEWILPLWNEANTHFSEIASMVCKSESGVPSIWGAMNDKDESNKRWDDVGKYMAGGETNVDAKVPEGWTKWTIPAQTYMVVPCTMKEYGEVFGKVTSDSSIQIVGTVHEHYPEPNNPNIVELYFPIADGMLFCQSCGMPLTKAEDFGTEADGSPSIDYCCHCYGNGAFHREETMEEMIESCIPFCREHYESDEAARADMTAFFPTLKRWTPR